MPLFTLLNLGKKPRTIRLEETKLADEVQLILLYVQDFALGYRWAKSGKVRRPSGQWLYGSMKSFAFFAVWNKSCTSCKARFSCRTPGECGYPRAEKNIALLCWRLVACIRDSRTSMWQRSSRLQGSGSDQKGHSKAGRVAGRQVLEQK